ncbi:E3 ubiquitin-protein ligase dbl4 [Puccinia graminis f. sp. tritici]|uniref:E3 ubiquitin-protein ligase dbl4 n=1 Tax=Puccinia graminis f. sp. tritici TaxID=56615 RepID=A0A5B0Q5X8_PUCGR|nr:E3 ubiquitin-protein ligase dbl4 [Puccinia graminis f. sp. tritici]
MTCKKCKHEFCWVCTGVWADHGTAWYSCNRYEERDEVGKDQQSKSRASLERYLHYYNRFANHEQSLRLDKELHAKTEKKMEEIQQASNLSWIEVQFLNKAVETLSVCRTTLKWTYAMAFYLEKNNFTALFEDNQRDLEQAVEDLSGLLESPIEADTIAELRQKVTDKTRWLRIIRCGYPLSAGGYPPVGADLGADALLPPKSWRISGYPLGYPVPRQ